jgi:hypothetical protein
VADDVVGVDEEERGLLAAAPGHQAPVRVGVPSARPARVRAPIAAETAAGGRAGRVKGLRAVSAGMRRIEGRGAEERRGDEA